MSKQTTYDYIVIGGGTAGAIVAARLAEAGKRVALFEAGPSDEGNAQVLELRHWWDLLGSELDYDYVIEPQPRGNSAIRAARGRVLGGCSSHNSCIAFFPPAYDLAVWEAQGAAGWGMEQCRPFFDKIRAKVHLEPVPPHNAYGRDFIQAAVRAGIPEIDMGEGEMREGVGWFVLNQKDGLRASSSVAYLHPLAQWENRITFFLNESVTRIVLEGDRAVGVETAAGLIEAEQEVILCAGAFDSPKLLLLSGIGPADHLREVGIPVRHDLVGVGENLLDHPEGVVNWEASRSMPKEIVQFWEIGLFANTLPDLPSPDLMLHVGSQPFDLNTAVQGYPTTTNGFAVTPNVARAKSQGRVWLRSANPADPPRIDFRYYSDPEGHDERVMVEGVKLARRIAQESPLREWIGRELSPGPEIVGDAAISAYVRQTGNTVYHPAGTCRMGGEGEKTAASTGSGQAVVDPQLRVRGLRGLRVADASVFPTMIGVNPTLTCMLIGERCADFILRGL